ncbi:MAG: zinc-binding dehydrogenase, partial [Anaerolineae bacterium]|nr:zinc-binding dehydrogenase [Anaerolineae bacterium]
IQIAKLAGAKVYVVGSNAEKCEKAEALGADVVINREQTDDWAKEVFKLTNKQGVDVVVDNVGKATMFGSIRSARIGGRILVVGNTSGPIFDLDLRYIFSKHISIIGSTMGPHVDYVRVMKLVFEGKLKPVIGVRLPLNEAKEGHRLLEAGQLFGKVVIDVN